MEHVSTAKTTRVKISGTKIKLKYFSSCHKTQMNVDKSNLARTRIYNKRFYSKFKTQITVQNKLFQAQPKSHAIVVIAEFKKT